MNRLLAIFENRYTGGACLVLAFACRAVNILFVSYAGRDKMLLVLQSRNLLEGNGIRIPNYFTHSLENPVFDPTLYWPPGYPVLLAPFLKLFRYDLYWSTTTLDLIMGIGLIFIIRRICRQIGLQKAAVNIMTLIAGCFEYSFIHESLSTDLTSLFFLMLGFSFLIGLLDNKEFRVPQILITGFFLFLPSIFRYSYPPVSVGLPFLVFCFGMLKKDNLVRKKAAWLLITTSALVFISYFLIWKYSGSAGYILETERGLFPGNILRWTPFITASFFNLSFFSSQVIRHTGLSLESILLILEVVNVLAFILLFVLFINSLFVKKVFSSLTPFKWFVLAGGLISLLVMASLAYVSLTNKEQERMNGTWNYIYESRYFAFLFCYFQILFIAWIFQTGSFFRNRISYILGIVGSLALFIEVSHNIYFHIKVATDFSHYKNSVYREQDYAAFNSLLPEIEREYRGRQILVASPYDHYYKYKAIYEGHTGVSDPDNLINALPEVNRPCLLVLTLHEKHLPSYNMFMEKYHPRFLKQVQYTRFYLLELNPE